MNHHPAQQAPAPATVDHGALSQLLTCEEIDDAVDVLERLISIREREDEAMHRYTTDYTGTGLAMNRSLRDAIEQLNADRAFRAIPEAAMDAAILCLESTDSPEYRYE
ncbi:hypothetical protein [Kocuria marina]|uniref:hypothetical protein n=1 Tax=Kocuria marina TaxID=223184 RepID=UPI0022E2487C|nr:hypothetical protein [Kocuria marina]